MNMRQKLILLAIICLQFNHNILSQVSNSLSALELDGFINLDSDSNERWTYEVDQDGNLVFIPNGSSQRPFLVMHDDDRVLRLLNDNFISTIKTAISLGTDGSNNEPFIELNKKNGIQSIIMDTHSTNDHSPFLKLNYNLTGKSAILIDADGLNQGPQITLFNHDFTTNSDSIAIRLVADGENSEPFIELKRNDGSSAIKIDAEVNGDSRITTDELEIVGGSDFAENFDIISSKIDIVPGMIVSIDPNSTGKLKIASESYDKKVAGIISGANGVETGLFMGQKGSIADGQYPIALSGRVFVFANHDGGAITPGDLLTTSSTPGVAMKVKNNVKAKGAIIGKAMTGIDENGYVLVLVNLQ